LDKNKSPVWFTARVNAKNAGYFEAVPIGEDPVTGMIDYRITIDEETFVVAHRPDKSIWHLLYRALDASLYGSDEDEDEIPEL
jgi:hypothetical protein